MSNTSDQFVVPTEGQTHVVRIYADEMGNSHLEELVISTRPGKETRSAQAVPVEMMFIREYVPNAFVDWHRAPARQFAITILGELVVEVSGSVRRRVRTGELVFLEDTRGKGHITRLKDRVTNLFLRVPDNFDVVTWARGKL